MGIRSRLFGTALVVATISAGAAMAQSEVPLSFVQALSRSATTLVQERLRDAGMFLGTADGSWGDDSQSALDRFQQARGLPVTGSINVATAQALGIGVPRLVPVATDPAVAAATTVPAPVPATTTAPVPAPTTAPVAALSPTSNLPPPTAGLPSSAAPSLGAQPSVSAPSSTSEPVPLTPNAVRNVQLRLQAYGLYRMYADGIWGSGTQWALQQFQRQRGIEATGQLNPVTAQALGLNPNTLEISYQ